MSYGDEVVVLNINEKTCDISSEDLRGNISVPDNKLLVWFSTDESDEPHSLERRELLEQNKRNCDSRIEVAPGCRRTNLLR